MLHQQTGRFAGTVSLVCVDSREYVFETPRIFSRKIGQAKQIKSSGLSMTGLVNLPFMNFLDTLLATRYGLPNVFGCTTPARLRSGGGYVEITTLNV
jgi:hypothetical protein